MPPRQFDHFIFGCIVVIIVSVSYTHLLEGVAFGLRDSLEVARSLGIKIERTKICGGGAKSPLWKKIIANVMNLKVDVIESEEGPGYGGAMPVSYTHLSKENISMYSLNLINRQRDLVRKQVLKFIR